jgi:hypothetical protein
MYYSCHAQVMNKQIDISIIEEAVAEDMFEERSRKRKCWVPLGMD